MDYLTLRDNLRTDGIKSFVRLYLEKNPQNVCERCTDICKLLEEPYECNEAGLNVKINEESRNISMKQINISMKD